MNDDTIAAIASAPVSSAIGIIRVSGNEVLPIMSTLFNIDTNSIKSRYMYTKNLIDPSTSKLIDNCCFTYFKGPNSYTGNDTLEIFCHGSTFICQKILTVITSLKNCRQAKNGEFTQQAFVNGKIDLAKAESILDIIESNSEKSHQIALDQYKGAVYKQLQETREELMVNLQELEASLEFPDDVGSINVEHIKVSLMNRLKKLKKIKENSDYGQKIKGGIRFLIIGKPNVGKSSLMNCISGEERSIVSNEAGTTRDYLDMSFEYNGILITIIDTAGIRDTSNEIETLGINKIKELSKIVDGYIFVQDINDTGKADIPDFIDDKKPILNVINKVDLSSNKLKLDGVIYTSCLSKIGINQLKNQLINSIIKLDNFESELILCNTRQIASLNETLECISNAMTLLTNNLTLDVICIEIRDAIHQLSNILGEDFTEELLDGIFSKFCIGK